MNISLRKHAIYYLISYSILLIYLFFLWSLPNHWFRDREIYLIYAEDYDTFLKTDKLSLQLVNEPIFSQIAGLFHEQAEIFPIFMSILVASTYFIFLINKSKTVITFLLGMSLLLFNSFLIFPQIFQLRQGLATAIFLIIFFSVKSQKIRLLLSCLLPFIHVAFFIIIPIFFIYELYLQYKNPLRIFLYTFLTTLLFSTLSLIIMQFLGFRQFEVYSTLDEGKSGGSLVLHILLLIYIFLNRNINENKLMGWVIIGLTFYIFSYYIFPAAGRLFISFYPFILIYMISRSKIQDVIVLLLISIVYIYLFFTSSYLEMLTISEQSFNNELSHFLF